MYAGCYKCFTVSVHKDYMGFYKMKAGQVSMILQIVKYSLEVRHFFHIIAISAECQLKLQELLLGDISLTLDS